MGRSAGAARLHAVIEHRGNRIDAYIQIAIGFAVAAIAAGAGLKLFPGFRSRESKSGTYRPGVAPTVSSRLPLVGGPAILIAIGAGGIAAVIAGQGTVILMILLAGVPFFAIGFADDLKKAARGRGFGDGRSFFLAAGAAAIAAIVYTLAPVAESPFGLRHWVGAGAFGDVVFGLWAFLLFLVVAVSTGISDGVDGLTSGLSTIAAVGIALAATAAMAASGPAWIVAGASAGILVLNLPSSWAPRAGRKRRARIYLGDSGALLLGALLTAAALAAGVDLLLPLIGGILILEGLSSVVQAKILVPFYRRSARFGGPERHSIHHSEFPLPFVAAPFHHHLELIGLGRRQLVLLLWTFAAGGAGVALVIAAIGTIPWTVALYGVGVLELAFVWFGFSSLRPARLIVQATPDGSCLALVHGWRRRRFGLLPTLTARRHLLPEGGAVFDSVPLDRPMNPIAARRLFDEVVAGFDATETGS